MLCAFLHQLFSQNKNLLKYAMSLYHLNGDKLPQFSDGLWTIFVAAVDDSTAPVVFCVLDVLDECAETSRLLLLKKLVEYYLQHDSTAKLKMIITSRSNTTIGDKIWRHKIDSALT